MRTRGPNRGSQERTSAARVEREVTAALRRSNIGRNDTVLMAISGGPDSVALTHLLADLAPRIGFRLVAAHFNHRLRGAESDRDERFVIELCARLGIDLNVGHAARLDPASANLEERARDARYEFLEAAADCAGATRIALGHHADDQAETVLFRMLRGTGVAGLAAMAAAGPGRRIRPMLRLARKEILAYLRSIGAEFVTDSSNLSLGPARNRIRLELMPALERLSTGGVARRLAALAGEMRELDDFISELACAELAARLDSSGRLALTGFARMPRALRSALIRAFIAARIGDLRRLTRAHIEAVEAICLADAPGARADLPGRWRAAREYGFLVVTRAALSHVEPFSRCLARVGMTEVPEAGFIFASRIAEVRAMAPHDEWEACFDAEEAAGGLTVRSFNRGDRVSPIGMAGSRKLQDVFVDRKLGRAMRAAYPIVTIGGAIAWVPGILRGRVALVREGIGEVLLVRARRVDRCGENQLKTIADAPLLGSKGA